MANRSSTKQRTGRGGLKLWSPSQVKQKEGCEVRWAANRWLGIEEGEGENAKKGTFRHGELEAWYGRHLFAGKNLNLFLPKTKEACAMVTHMGKMARGTCETEVAVRFDLEDEPFVGYIDMVYSWALESEPEMTQKGGLPRLIVTGQPVELGSTDVVVIHDWKFTSNTKYALDERGLDSEALFDDPAANLYAKEAFEGGAKRVFCRWVYCEFESQTPQDLWAEMKYQDILTYCEHARCVARDGRLKKQAWQRGLLNVLDLPKNKDYCFAFKKECPYKGECKPESDRKRITLKGKNQMSTADFQSQVNSVTGGERKAPPALPGKKAPPALPGKKAPPALPGKSPVAEAAEHFAGDAPVESGTFNAPNTENRKVLAATPEEAAQNQDIKAPVETGAAAGEAQDDLDAMDVSQLKALATALGIEFTPKARAATVISLIRSKRAHEGLDEITETVMAPQLEVIKERIAEIVEKKATPELPAKKLAPSISTPRIAQTLDADGDSAESEAGYVLYINCAPVGAHITLASIIGRFSADLQETAGVSDYRADSALTAFGKGKGIIAEALNDEISSGLISGAVVVDSRTAEGSEFVGILERHAVLVVRGF